MSTQGAVAEAVERLGRRDPTLATIRLMARRCTDAELAELVDSLLGHPDVATAVYLAANQLTDKTGVKLARYLAASSTIETFNLGYNKFGEATYLALAAALRVNTSLRCLYLNGNQAVDQTCVDAAFVEALRLNPDRPMGSTFWLNAYGQDELPRLKDAAEQLGHPSLQLLLSIAE